MIEIGRLCRKIAGRDAGLTCVIVDIDEDGTPFIDGETRRRKCNPHHLIALPQKVDIAKGANHDEVLAALGELGITGRKTKPKHEEKKPGRMKKAPEEPAKAQDKKAGKSATKNDTSKAPEAKNAETKKAAKA